MPNIYPPPQLSTWSLVWRYGLSGLSYLFMLIVPALASTNLSVLLLVVDAVLGLLGFVLIRFRRRWPLPVVLVFALASVFSASIAVLAYWAFVSLCTRRRWREIVVAVVVSGLVTASSSVINFHGITRPNLTPMDLIVAGVVVGLYHAVGIAMGMYVGARRDGEASLRDRAETAEREQELRVRQGQADERNRIAREMHDVLAHRLSLISMHAGVLAYRDNLTAEQTRQVATTIQENAHASLEELRGVLGSLRSTDAAPEKPQPNLPQIPGLIAEAEEAGARVDYSSEIDDPDRLPPAIGRHAYRIVQEALTNARKHAPHARIAVSLRGAAGVGLTITVRNPTNRLGGTVPGAGVGLLGLAERAAITGGRISHGVGADGVFDLTVWLPW